MTTRNRKTVVNVVKLKKPNMKEALHIRASEVLHYFWDPIGIAGIPATRGEYDFYLPKLVEMLIAGDSKRRLARYLMDVENESIGLARRPKVATEVAEILLNWQRCLNDRPSRTKRTTTRRLKPKPSGPRRPVFKI
jgi:hypothetical protein